MAKIKHSLTIHNYTPIFKSFEQNSQFSNRLFLVKLQRIMQNSLNSPTNPSKLCEIHYKIHPHSLHTFRFRFLTIGRELKERIAQISHILPTVPMNYVKFTHMASNLIVNPMNSRKIQWITQIPHHLHPQQANYTKFATFAHKQESYIHLYTYFMHIVIAHILHVCTYFFAPS